MRFKSVLLAIVLIGLLEQAARAQFGEGFVQFVAMGKALQNPLTWLLLIALAPLGIIVAILRALTGQ